MTRKTRLSPIFSLLLGGASLTIIVAGMKAAAPIFNSFFLALLIALNVTPLLRWLERKRLPGWLSLLITIVTVIVALLTLITFLGISVSQLLEVLPTYEVKLAALKEAFKSFLAANGIDISKVLSLDVFSPARLIQGIAFFLVKVAQALSSSLLLVIIVAFMLLEATGFSVKLQREFTSNSSLLARFNEYSRDIRRYVWITTWTGLLSAIADTILMLLLGIDLALLWGVLFFLLNFIPGIGFLLAVIPPLLLALLEFGGAKALLFLFGCWLIDNVMDKGVKPRYMQQSLDLSSLLIILSVIFWSWVLGPMGAILAVPLTMTIKKIVLESSEDTRFLAVLMGAGKISTINPSANSDENDYTHPN